MSTYTRIKCPRCGETANNWTKNNEYWRDKIGEPFITCPRCGAKIRNYQYDEYIMLDNPKVFLIKYCIVDFIKSILFGGILGSTLFFCIDGGELFTLIIYAVIGVLVFIALHALALWHTIKKSLERTEDITYRTFLHNKGLISKFQFETNSPGKSTVLYK